MPDPLPVLVLDFDGTVCVGDGPVWAYADAVFAHLTPGEVGPLRARLTAFLGGDPDKDGYPDGYMAVAALVAGRLDPAQLDAAYLASRQVLGSSTVDIATPAGLPELLAKLDGKVRRVLVTNAPPDGVTEALAALGLTAVIDEVRADAGKPRGLHRILADLLTGRRPEQVLSVGDFYANDIAVPLEHGCVTAFIDRFDQRTGPAHVRAGTFELLYDDVLAWADDPAGFAAAHPPAD